MALRFRDGVIGHRARPRDLAAAFRVTAQERQPILQRSGSGHRD
jgi:hypothetical protein